jgi:hypothetical protein
MTVLPLPPVVVGRSRRRSSVRAALGLRATSRVAGIVAAGSACLVLVAGLVHLDARGDLRAERATLTRARLERAVAADDAARSAVAVTTAEAALAAARSVLAEATTLVEQVRGDLATRTDQRDALQAQARAATDELTGVRSSLVAGFTELGLQGAQITALEVCLNGVSRALLQLAFEDGVGAAGSLRAVGDACDTAAVALDVPAGPR